MSDLTTCTTPIRVGPDLFHADVPDGWQQGRGAFGGLVLGTLVRAIEQFEAGDGSAPPRPLRALTAEICGPVLPGLNVLRVERFRAGTGMSTVGARLERDGEVLAHAVGVLGRPRVEDTDFCDLPAPAMPPWREVAVVPVAPPFGPVFARHFEYRPVSAGGTPAPPGGGLPFQGGAEAVASGWVRAVDPGPARDAAYVTSLVDVWWPALFSRLAGPRPMATVAFTLEILGDLEGLDPIAPFFHHARAHAARGGYTVEMRELRGEDGRLVALNQQTIAIIK